MEIVGVIPKKNDHNTVFKGVSRAGTLDYVCCWFKKSAEYIYNTDVKVALVATSSITQGTQVSVLWKHLMYKYNVNIDFRYKSFQWNNLASKQAGVWCVIIGFSTYNSGDKKLIFTKNGFFVAKNINGYLIDCGDVFIDSRDKPICSVPQLYIGNQLVDGGNYLFSSEEMKLFLEKEPKAKYLFKPWYGADEFLKDKKRYCLYVVDYDDNLPLVNGRIKAVREIRKNSPRKATRNLADTPTKFCVTNTPKHDFLVIPKATSSARTYIPMGFLKSGNIPSDRILVLDNAEVYHFGVLISAIHMEWVRAFSGRLCNEFNYSINVVYNNFPWPNPTKKQKQNIEETAQHILDIRDKYKDKTYTYLYNPDTMPYDLLLAHERNDKAVMEAYGMKDDYSSSKILDKLIRMYSKRIEELEINENK